MATKSYNFNADPTKDFFISMLVRDINLSDAIGDLVDNSVDAANEHLNNKSKKVYKIHITTDKEEFKIEDNCGGIEIDRAKKYAFKFGKPSGEPFKNYSTGQFGIGMKRAFFKIGSKIKIYSWTTEQDNFEVEINVDDWLTEKTWEFEYKTNIKQRKIFGELQSGTVISIEKLHKNVKESFVSENERTRLKNELKLENTLNLLNKKIEIKLNNSILTPPFLSIISNEKIKPAYYTHSFENDVEVKILAGVSEDLKDEGGWYVFFNNRLIIGPDTSKTTGWTGGKGKDKGDGVALYHDQYFRFRGYIFFNSQNPTYLPWTTTKTTVDDGSPLYKNVRQKMIDIMRPIMSFMNKVKQEKEKNNPEKNRKFNIALENSKPQNIFEILNEPEGLKHTFSCSIREFTPVKDGVRVSFLRPKEQVEKVKKFFDVSKNGDAGAFAFDYFYKKEKL